MSQIFKPSRLTDPLSFKLAQNRFSTRIRRYDNAEMGFPDKQREAIAADPSLLPSILYFPHQRTIQPSKGEQIQREATTYQWVYRYESVASFPGSLDSYLIWLDYAEPETFTRVWDFLDSLDFGGKRFSINRKALKAVVILPEGSQHFLEQLSSSEQNILFMLLDLRRRLLPYNIVLFDEIENSLHPAFQQRLAQALLNMQKQIPFQLIVTTHAPAFVKIFGPESTLLLTEF